MSKFEGCGRNDIKDQVERVEMQYLISKDISIYCSDVEIQTFVLLRYE